MQLEALAILEVVTAALESLGVAHAVGGSFASSIHGVGRTTMDVDVVADLAPSVVPALARLLGDRFYLDVESAQASLRRGQAFNAIDQSTSFKVDVFPLGTRPWDREALARRVRVSPESGHSFWAFRAEDIVLAKLEWYRKGGEVSDVQWRDVQGVLRRSAAIVDRLYLGRWATAIGVGDLLARALAEADRA